MYDSSNLTRAWAEIDLAAIRQNYNESAALAKSYGADTLAVIKANAYGHGAVRVASELTKYCGAKHFAVATFPEAVELVRAGIRSDILILSELSPTLYDDLVLYSSIIPCIFHYESAKDLSAAAKKQGVKARCYLVVDTGMSRIGLECTTPEKMSESLITAKRIVSLENIEVIGIFSHYACADCENKDSAFKQTESFKNFTKSLSRETGHSYIRSMCNSAALMGSAFTDKFDLVRAGICLYGFPPSEYTEHSLRLKPAMALRARITNVKVIESGTGISYGHTFVTERDTRVATVPIGYADGYPRLLSSTASVIIDDKPAPILGRVCMDQMMVDVTDIPSAGIGSVATLMGADERVRADRLADMMGTISYELVCGISARVPRIYTNAYDSINSD